MTGAFLGTCRFVVYLGTNGCVLVLDGVFNSDIYYPTILFPVVSLALRDVPVNEISPDSMKTVFVSHRHDVFSDLCC